MKHKCVYNTTEIKFLLLSQLSDCFLYATSKDIQERYYKSGFIIEELYYLDLITFDEFLDYTSERNNLFHIF